MMNRAARLVMRAHKTVSTNPILGNLHWLPMMERVKFKVLVYAFKAVPDIILRYVTVLVRVGVPGGALPSSTGPPRLEPAKRLKRTR